MAMTETGHESRVND